MVFESLPSFSEITVAEAHRDRGREDLEATEKRHLALLTQGTHLFCAHGALHLWERKVPGQQAPSAQNTLSQLVACPGKEENAKEQRTGSRTQGKVTASQAAHWELDGPKAKNARKVQPHEKPISTQFEEEIRVMDGTNTSDPWQCIPQGLT